ncbi:MAG: pyridoxamine 5'-phosphate oxidase family protein [Burkholderiaceae bacterium]|nr:pyridoxamine 5'-phosphate oxidase family protein [Burkholderiaceae bacterium]MCF8185156.1 pyridoxamine 5'-phosphate oxidase family protein [Polynucleobacter sp.]
MPLILPPPVADYLAGHHVMTLATQGAEGPWAAAVFYASDGCSLVFLSSPSTRHCRNLALDARCAATIQEDYSDWAQIKGIQLEGRVTVLQGDEERRAQQLYGDKFPIAGPLGKVPSAIVKALARVSWFRLVPEHFHFIDNSRGFGHRDEIALGRG